MAPDVAAATAGRKLGRAAQWQALGASERAVWGECRGSALYQTRVSVLDWQTKCSCPSRKFPCKHALGLLFIMADSLAAFGKDPEPEWVTNWLDKRDAAAQKKQARAEQPAKPVDTAAQAKRATKRHEAVLEGLDQLDVWLADLVRTGLARLPSEGAAAFELQARRLVDAQAPGLAALVRAIKDEIGGGDAWTGRVLGELGKLALLSHAYRRGEALPPLLVQDVRRRIGYTIEQSEVIAHGDVVEDDWSVVGQVTEDDERVRSQRTWLVGARTGRSALVLQFAAGSAKFVEVLVVGTTLTARLAFWPASVPERALVVTRLREPRSSGDPPKARSIGETLTSHAQALALDPWLERQLCVLGQVSVVPGKPWLLVDDTGAALPLGVGRHDVLLAVSGGQPVVVVAEWDGFVLTPLTVFNDGRVVPVARETTVARETAKEAQP